MSKFASHNPVTLQPALLHHVARRVPEQPSGAVRRLLGQETGDLVDEQGREAFRAFVSVRSGALLRTAYLLTRQRADAEDLLQAAPAETYLAWDRIADRNAVDAYVRRVMVNRQTSSWRRHRVTETLTDRLPGVGCAGRDATADLDLHDALWSALATLPRRQRAAVVLRYYQDLSEAETADALGVSIGTVKSTTSRALARLRTSTDLRDDLRLAPPASGAPA